MSIILKLKKKESYVRGCSYDKISLYNNMAGGNNNMDFALKQTVLSNIACLCFSLLIEETDLK